MAGDRADFLDLIECRLRPLTEEEIRRLRQREVDKSMAEMKVLAREIGAAWTSEQSSVELVTGQRR